MCRNRFRTSEKLLSTGFRKITHLGVISAVFLGTVSLVTPRLRICKRDAHIWFGTCAEIGSTVRELLGTVFREMTPIRVHFSSILRHHFVGDPSIENLQAIKSSIILCPSGGGPPALGDPPSPTGITCTGENVHEPKLSISILTARQGA